MAWNNPFVPQQALPDTSNQLTASAPNSADAWQANAAAYQQWADAQRKDGIARGLIDPETGWPTGAALVDAAHQYGSALLGSTAAPGGSPQLARAKAMGFDTATVWKHGTSGDHTTLSPSYAGGVTSHGDPGIWFTQSTPYASEYAQNAAGITGGDPRIIEAHLKSNKPLVVRFPDGPRYPTVNDQVMDFHDNADIMRYAIQNGHDVVYMPDGNFTEESAAASVLDPRNIQHACQCLSQ